MPNHMCLINKNGLMKCWGLNISGQLGLGDTNNRGDELNEMENHLPFVSIGIGFKVNQVSTGGLHTCVHLIDSNSSNTSYSIKCWGLNADGQLGLGSGKTTFGTLSTETPDKLDTIKIGNESSPKVVACGSNHSCVLFNNKKVKCFGSNMSGQIGYEGVTSNKGSLISDMGDNLPFLQFGTGIEVESLYVNAAADHNCVILASSQLIKCWGFNNAGQLGFVNNDQDPYEGPYVYGKTIGTMGDNLPTLDLGLDDRVKMVGLGSRFTCVLRLDDVLFCYGMNSMRLLGSIESITESTEVPKAGSVSTLLDFPANKIKYIAGGNFYLCLLFDDDITLRCSRNNFNNQLGNTGTPSTAFQDYPAIDLGTGNLKISAVDAAGVATCVIFIDNSVKCFGDGHLGTLGYGNQDYIGDALYEMGKNLSFVSVFEQTTAPTKSPSLKPTRAPTLLCNYLIQKKCEKDEFCEWKKKKCSVFDCSKFTSRSFCIATNRCEWKKGTCKVKTK